MIIICLLKCRHPQSQGTTALSEYLSIQADLSTHPISANDYRIVGIKSRVNDPIICIFFTEIMNMSSSLCRHVPCFHILFLIGKNFPLLHVENITVLTILEYSSFSPKGHL